MVKDREPPPRLGLLLTELIGELGLEILAFRKRVTDISAELVEKVFVRRKESLAGYRSLFNRGKMNAMCSAGDAELNSLDASSGGVFRIMNGPAMLE